MAKGLKIELWKSQEEEETFTNIRGPADTDTKYKNVDIIYFVCDII